MFQLTFTTKCDPRKDIGDDWTEEDLDEDESIDHLEVLTPGELASLNGFTDPVELSDYFHGEPEFAGVTGGICSFHVVKDELFLRQTYYMPTKPTPAIIEALWDYTAGQNSDGWGEGFEQRPFPGTKNIYVSPPWGFKGLPEYFVIEVDGPEKPILKLEVDNAEYAIIMGLVHEGISHCQTEPMMDKLNRLMDGKDG